MIVDLFRHEVSISIEAYTWDKILKIAEKNGWRPQRGPARFRYVPRNESLELAAALEVELTFLKKVKADEPYPWRLIPTSGYEANSSYIRDIIGFLRKGGFLVS